MRFTSIAALLVAFAGSSNAFAPSLGRSASTSLKMSSDTHMGQDFTADSGLTVAAIPMYIDNLNQQNFVETLEMLEPLLINECRGETCEMFVEDLKEKAKSIGKEIPSNYAPLHP